MEEKREGWDEWCSRALSVLRLGKAVLEDKRMEERGGIVAVYQATIDLRDAIEDVLARVPSGGRPPIPMRLACEGCGELHIDEGEFATKPHHTHSCQHCGLTWRPAIVPTVGVRFLPGFRNEAPPRAGSQGEAVQASAQSASAAAMETRAESSSDKCTAKRKDAHGCDVHCKRPAGHLPPCAFEDEAKSEARGPAIGSICTHPGPDWCHVCQTKQEILVDVWFSCRQDGRLDYARVCETCILEWHANAVKEAERQVWARAVRQEQSR